MYIYIYTAWTHAYFTYVLRMQLQMRSSNIYSAEKSTEIDDNGWWVSQKSTKHAWNALDR